MSDILIGVFVTLGTGLLIGVVVLIVEYKTNLFHKESKKELTATLVWESTLANLSEYNQDDLAITWKGERLENLPIHQLIIRIENTGTEEIRVSDFEGGKPIAIAFDEGQLLSAGHSASHLGVSISLEPQVVVIEPLLLNRGESFSVTVLVNGEYSYYIRSRIAGIGEIKLENEYVSRYLKNQERRPQISVGMLVIILAIILSSFVFIIFLVISGRPILPEPTSDMQATLEAIDAHATATVRAFYASTPTPTP